MATIYVVTTGVSDDYRIDGVYDDKELAEKARELCDGYIEEYEPNANKFDEYLRRNELYFVVTVHTAESAKRSNKHKTAAQSPTMEGDAEAHKITPYGAGGGIETEAHPRKAYQFADGHTHDYYLWARDKEHAKKIAGERHAKWLVTWDGKIEGHASGWVPVFDDVK